MPRDHVILKCAGKPFHGILSAQTRANEHPSHVPAQVSIHSMGNAFWTTVLSFLETRHQSLESDQGESVIGRV